MTHTEALEADLRWHEERHGTRAEQEASDREANRIDAEIAALSDAEIADALRADGLDPEEVGRRGQATARWAIERARRWQALVEGRDELRLTLLAERGDPAGAPSEGWGYDGKWYGPGGVTVRRIDMSFIWAHDLAPDARWLWSAGGTVGHAPTAREAMKAADAAAKGEQG